MELLLKVELHGSAFHLWLHKTQSCRRISEKREWLYLVFAVHVPQPLHPSKPSQQNDCLHLRPCADWTCTECSYMCNMRWIWLLGMSCHWNARLKWSSVQTRIPHRAVVKLPTFLTLGISRFKGIIKKKAILSEYEANALASRKRHRGTEFSDLIEAM